MSERETAQLRDQTMNYLRSNTWLTNGRYRSRPESQTQLIRSACLTDHGIGKENNGKAFASHDPDRSISHNSRLVPLDLTSQHPNPRETEMIVAVCKISHPSGRRFSIPSLPSTSLQSPTVQSPPHRRSDMFSVGVGSRWNVAPLSNKHDLGVGQ